jgi:hypothetical protein
MVSPQVAQVELARLPTHLCRVHPRDTANRVHGCIWNHAPHGYHIIGHANTHESQAGKLKRMHPNFERSK